MVKFWSFFLAALMLALPFAVFAGQSDGGTSLQNKNYYSAILERELEYFDKLTLECGAVAMYPLEVSSYPGMTLPVVNGISPSEYTKWPSAAVVPYFSDTMVLGAIRADSAIGTGNAKENALKYINWYISHMNTAETDICGVAGTVYDYHIFQSADGRTVELTDMEMYASQYPNGGNTHNYDSTDSYAAMFLQILYEYAKTYDADFLENKAGTVQTLIDVMMSDYIYGLDLTVAKPNYPACYLMDNCEVYCGFVSAAGIYTEFLNDPAKAAECAARADKVKNAILTRMWSKTDQCFLAAISDKGVSMFSNDLNNFYPQASCQLFPVIFGVIPPDDEKAVITYERFKADFGSRWLNFSIETFPWCVLVRAAVNMGDCEFAGQFMEAVNNKYVKRAHKYPYHCSESGSVMVAAAELYALAEEAPEEESSGSGPEDPGHGGEHDGPASYITLKCGDRGPVPILTFSIPASLVGGESITVEALVRFGEDCEGNVYLNLYPYKGTALLKWTDYATSTLNNLGTWETVGVKDWDPRKNGASPDRYELGIGFYLATGTVSVAYIKVSAGSKVVWYLDFADGIDYGSEYLVKHLNVTPETEGEVWYITVNERPGDMNGDGSVNSDDAVYLLRHALFSADYPVEGYADFDCDGEITSDDAIYLLRHVLFPADYPLAIR
ncbi:MAG: hypothetical protein J5760_04920 [Clostridia bacterium]|nr:hypothetical protein [Clostridia bacterium]